jgi:ATP-dependent DNA helicase MPH1
MQLPTFKKLEEKIMRTNTDIDHPKLNQLTKVLNQFFKGNMTSRAIVFTEYRNSAKNITDHINATVPDSTASVFVGQKNSEGITMNRKI